VPKSVLVLSIYMILSFLYAPKLKAQQTLSARIDSIIALMTNQEKIDQLCNNAFFTTATNTRLNIPGFTMSDGPHGVRYASSGTSGNTAFPVGMAMAATFDMNMLYQVGKAMGEEFWVNGIQQQLGPCIDLCRDPRAGRSAESGGEDPYLSGRVGAAIISAVQANTPVISTVKHFMVESKQSNRNTCNEIFTDRWMLEHYGYNFRYATQEGGPLSLMDAYNLINGVHCTENIPLLKTTLRQRWGFPFYVVSDWASIYTSLNAITAGTDICMGSSNYANDLPGLVSGGSLSTTVLNSAVANVLRTKIMSGMMDYYPTANPSFMNSTAHQQVAYQCAEKSIVLLKNTNKILPINASTVTNIAVIGPSAARCNLNCWGSSEVAVPFSYSVLAGLQNRIGSSKINYTIGCAINSTDTSGFAAAKTLAKAANYVIFVGGLDSTQEGEAYGIGNDRASGSIDLPGSQQALIIALAKVNPNLIAVIESGGVCGIDKSIGSMKGLLYAFYPAQEAGYAIADVIVGNYNPGGRMPVTMPKSDSQLPTWDDDYTNDYGCGYRWFDQNGTVPEFAFGFGLSYSTFAYSNLQLSTHSAPAGTPVTVSVDVQNTGTVDGEEVVQVYEHNLSSPLWMPKKELKGFQRVAIKASAKQTVSLTLTAEDFYYWDVNHSQYTIEPGMFSLAVGGSSDNLPLIDSVNLISTTGKPDLKITQIMTMPRYPIKGQKVRCYALVKNQGTATVKAGTTVNISFTADNAAVASVAYAVPDSIPAGGARLIESTTTWQPTTSGTYLLAGTVDNTGTIDEWIETNNTTSRKITVIDSAQSPTANLALNKPVVVSSIESATYPGTYAVDGLSSTRWSTAFSDPQYIVVDLEAVYALTSIVVNWEAAYAKTYTISVSKDSATWTTVENITAGAAGITTFSINATARYVKLTGTSRATAYGYSLYELQVFGASAGGTPIANAGGDQTLVNPTNIILNGTGSSDPDGKTLTYTWTQLTGPTTATLAGASSATLTATNITNGQYVFELSVSNGTNSNSDVAIITISGLSNTETQTINLKKGLNLISFYVSPNDKTIATVFSGIISNVVEIKDASGFWRAGQNTAFNSLISITNGDAFIINMSAAATLTVSGSAVSVATTALKTGWNMVGYPKSASETISTTTSGIKSSLTTIKSFDGYYQPSGATNSITTFDPGKGYFINANAAATVTW